MLKIRLQRNQVLSSRNMATCLLSLSKGEFVVLRQAQHERYQ